jgi:MFS family permease
VFHKLGFSEDHAAVLFSAGSFGLAGGRILLSLIGPRFTPSQVLFTMLFASVILTYVQCCLAVAGVATVPGWGLALFCICYVGASVGSSCAYAWLLALYSSCQAVTGMVNGMVLVVVNLGIIFVVNLIGHLYDHFGALSFFIANCSFSTVGLLTVVLFHVMCQREIKRQSEICS